MAAKQVDLEGLCQVLEHVTIQRLRGWIVRNSLPYDLAVTVRRDFPKDKRPKRITIDAHIYRQVSDVEFVEMCAMEHFTFKRRNGRPFLPEELWFAYERAYFSVLSELRSFAIADCRVGSQAVIH